MKTSHLSYTFLGSFLIAIFCLQWWQQAAYPSAVWIVLGSLIFIAILIGHGPSVLTMTPLHKVCHPEHGRRATHYALFLFVSVIGINLAFITIQRTTHVPSPTTIDFYNGKGNVTITGIIGDMPDNRPTSMRYTVDVKTLTIGGNTISVTGKILVTDLRMYPRFAYGDEVHVTGAIEQPQKSDTFDYDAYLSRFDIYSTMRASSLNFISANHGNVVIAMLSGLKSSFETGINRVFPEPEASFLAGLLTGSRRGMPDRITQAFQLTGLTHIVAISGFNITIVIALIGSLLFFLPFKWRFVPTAAAIILFTLLVGASASVVRAAIMGILGLIALQAGRMAQARLIILWTAFFMLLWNPKELWVDAGFQLSFLAVLGLVECQPLLKPLLQKLPGTLAIRETLAMTIAAQLFAMPWVVHIFGILSLISPIANLLIEPLIPFAMLLGFIGTVLAMFSLPFGQLVAFPAWGLLHAIIWIAETLAAIPGSSMQLQSFNLPLLTLYYMTLIIVTIEWHKRSKGLSFSVLH